MSPKDAVSEEIDRRREALVAFLDELVSTPTVTGDEGPGQERIVDRFEANGWEPDVWEPTAEDLRGHDGYFETSTFVERGYEGRPNVAARIPGSGDGPTLAVSGHIDVVGVNEDEWEHDPWSLSREGDELYGRGAADMKGGLAAAVVAAECLQALDVELGGDLLLLSTIEEEDGGVGGLLSALERGYQPDAAVVPEPLALPNIGVASAGVMYFRLTVPGKSAHAAAGHLGVNAIGKAAKLYEALESLNQERKARIEYPRAHGADPSLEGNVTNINLGTIEAGDWPSTVPAEAVIEGRVGWPPGETREAVRAQIEDRVSAVAETDDWLAAHPPSVEWFGWQAEPHEVPTDAEIVQLAKRNAEAVTGRTGAFIGGNAGLDERFYKLYYDIDAATMGPAGENTHGADEFVSLTSLLETSTAIAWTAMDYCGVEGTG